MAIEITIKEGKKGVRLKTEQTYVTDDIEIIPEITNPLNNYTIAPALSEQEILTAGTYYLPKTLTVGAVSKVERASTIITSATANNQLTFTAANDQKTGYVEGENKTASKTVSLSSSGKTVTASDGINSISKSVDEGSVSVPNKTITANPSITIDQSDDKIYASISASQEISPTIKEGYVSGGTAGTITIEGALEITGGTIVAEWDNQVSAQEERINILFTPTKAGYYTTETKDSLIAITDLKSDHIKYNSTVCGLSGTYSSSNKPAVAADILKGKEAFVNGSEVIVGTIETGPEYNNPIIPTKKQQYLGMGGKYCPYEIVVDAIPDEYIKTNIIPDEFGSGEMAAAEADNILEGHGAYWNGVWVKGTMTNWGPVSGSLTLNTTTNNYEYIIPKGYHNGDGSVSIGSAIGAISISQDPLDEGLENDRAIWPIYFEVTSSGYIEKDQYDDMVGSQQKASFQLPYDSGGEYNPKATDNTILSAGTYVGGDVIIKGDENLKAENIKTGVTIFGVTGNYGAVSYPSVTEWRYS